MNAKGEFVFLTDQIEFSKVEVKGGEPEYYVTGYIATKDRDLVDDMISEKGMSGMLSQLSNFPIKLDYDHEHWRGERLFWKLDRRGVG